MRKKNTAESRTGDTNLGEFVLHVCKDEEKAADGVPEPAMSQGQLVPGTRALQQQQPRHHTQHIDHSLMKTLAAYPAQG